MKTQQFKVKLLEEVVISQRAATEGGHESLDSLPGAVFLGAVATHLYDKLLKNENSEDAELNNAYTVFHSGKVRFGNALPLSKDDQLSYPRPLCWYKDKNKSDDHIKTEWRNYQHGEYSNTIQAEQVRKHYISLGAIKPKNRLTQVQSRFRMKTAINPDIGTAREGQLFGYSSLLEGQEFVFVLEADDDVNPDLWQQIVSIFEDKRLKLGRSRSAEYGAVKMTPFEKADERGKPQFEPEQGITLWLLADAALQNKSGQPLLEPTAESIGLPANFELDLEKTFVRSRRYAPFNASYRRRELERVVLSIGSVLHFTCQNNEINESDILPKLQEIQDNGIGLYRQAGLGRVWVNPELLANENQNPVSFFKKHELPSSSKKKSSIRPKEPKDHIVFQYLQARRAQASNIDTIEEQAKLWKSELDNLYKSARKLSYAPPGICVGPTATQWGQVMEKAKNAISTKKLAKKLFIGKHAVCKKHDQQWSKRVLYDLNKTSADNFRRWFLYKICYCRKTQNLDLLPQIVARFARLAIDVAHEQTKGK
jgi:hypothetical protein